MAKQQQIAKRHHNINALQKSSLSNPKMVLIWEPETGLVTTCTARHGIAVRAADYTDKGL